MNEPNVKELNRIQAVWMALGANDPEEFQKAVFRDMKKYPSAHLSVSNDKKMAVALVDSMPMWSSARPIDEAIDWMLEFLKAGHSGRADVAWCGGKGEWVEI